MIVNGHSDVCLWETSLVAQEQLCSATLDAIEAEKPIEHSSNECDAAVGRQHAAAVPIWHTKPQQQQYARQECEIFFEAQTHIFGQAICPKPKEHSLAAVALPIIIQQVGFRILTVWELLADESEIVNSGLVQNDAEF